jgi:GMP synthase-like glutamine amidotransferase
MRILSIVHEGSPSTALYGDVVVEQGNEHRVWQIDREAEPPDGPFDGVMIFGGTMDTHEEESFPWLRREDEELRRFVAAGTPLLGVCLGGQLLAKALGAQVERSPVPEIGWQEVVRHSAAADDPLFGELPEEFLSLQWHHYRFRLPDGAVPLASSPVCLQAFRFGDHVWGFQFHPEVTRETLQQWFDESERVAPDLLDYRTLERECDLNIAEWNRIGRELVSRFLAVAAERAREPEEARSA